MNKEAGGAYHYIWKDQNASIMLDEKNEISNTKLMISLYDTEIYGQGEFLGFVELDFVSLLTLNDGIFEYMLRPRNSIQRYIKGSITFKLRFHFPVWDSISMHIPSLVRRRITIVSSSDLPEVNGFAPNTKCSVSINGISRVTSNISDNSSFPHFSHSSVDVCIKNIGDNLDIIVFLYHVDHERKKDICIGQAVLPFEMILHPMRTPWVLSLATPNKVPPKRYRLFLPSGSVKVDVRIINNIDNVRQSFVSRELSMRCINPIKYNDNSDPSIKSGNIPTPEILQHCTEVLGGMELFEDGTLREDEVARMGTVVGLGSVQELCADNRWILIPIRNVGVKICNDNFPWAPGSRYVIALERDRSRIAEGDIAMIESVYQDVQHAVNGLRKKTLIARLRHLLFDQLKTNISDIIVENCDQEQVFEFTALSVMQCLSGCRVLIGREKSNLVKINLYENFSLVETFLIQRDHLTEEVCFGRNIKSRIFIDFNDLDLNQVFCCFNRRFCNQKFLRISVPIKSGDLGFGFVSIEDFETYIGGKQRSKRIFKSGITGFCWKDVARNLVLIWKSKR